jgi:hypothetical protein
MSLHRFHERQANRKNKKNEPIVRNTVQGRARDVVRFRVVVDFGDIREGVIVEQREGEHIEKLHARLAENSGRVGRVLLPKPKENLDSEG